MHIFNSHRHPLPAATLPDYNWILHLDANVDVYKDDGVTPPDNDTYDATYWHDQSISGNDAYQLTTNLKVRWLQNSSNWNFNNRASFDFSPEGGRHMNLTNPISLANDYTFIAVHYRYNDTNISLPLGGDTFIRNYPLLWSSNQYIYMTSQDGRAFGYDGLVGMSSGRHMTVTQSSNNGSSALIWHNGTVLGDENTLIPYPVDTLGDALYFGRRNTQYEKSMIGEFMMTNQVLTLQQIQNVEAFLYDKWGFTY